jgi:hypothetical protein
MPEYKIIPPPHDPTEDEIQVGPVEAESAAEVLARLEWRERESRRFASTDVADSEPIEPPRPKATFTLWQMLIVITGVSVWLGVLRLLSALKMPMLAGLTGIVALVAMFWISTREDQPAILRLVWWGMLLAFVTCSVVMWLGG